MAALATDDSSSPYAQICIPFDSRYASAVPFSGASRATAWPAVHHSSWSTPSAIDLKSHTPNARKDIPRPRGRRRSSRRPILPLLLGRLPILPLLLLLRLPVLLSRRRPRRRTILALLLRGLSVLALLLLLGRLAVLPLSGRGTAGCTTGVSLRSGKFRCESHIVYSRRLEKV